MRCARHLALLTVAIATAASACGSGKKKTKKAPPAVDAAPPPAPKFARTELKPPPPAPKPLTRLGRGPGIVYPTPVRLKLAKGVTPLDPPLRVDRVWSVPERALAVVSGRSKTGPTVQMIDMDSATIRWTDTKVCGTQVKHTLSDRILCAGWKGMVALDVDSGKELWRSELMFRTAWKRYAFAIDPKERALGNVVDVQTGKVLVQTIAPKTETFDEVKRICPAKNNKGFDVFAWSATGFLRRYHVPYERSGPVRARRIWRRQLRRRPSKVDLCDPVMLIEIPIPGRYARTLSALAKRSGKMIGQPLNTFGFWPAEKNGDLVMSTGTGLQIRNRRLKLKKKLTKKRVGGRLVALWNKMRLVRSHAGTLLLMDQRGVHAWLAAPAFVERAVITSKRLLAGSWLSPPRSGAEQITLYDLPKTAKLTDFAALAPAPAPKRLVVSTTAQRVKAVPKGELSIKSRPGAGEHAVENVVLAKQFLFMATYEGRPGPTRGGGIASYDIAKREHRWHVPDACGKHARVVALAVTDALAVCGSVSRYPKPGLITALEASNGRRLWQVKLPTVDRLYAAGSVVVASYGSRAAVLSAAKGEVIYHLSGDNNHQPRIVVTKVGKRTLVIAAERGGLIVARDPDAGGKAVWAVGIRGYLRRLQRTGKGLAATLASGELLLLNMEDGSASAATATAASWKIPGNASLMFDDARGAWGDSALRALGNDGVERFRAAYTIEPPLYLATLRGEPEKSPVVMLHPRGVRRVLIASPDKGILKAIYKLPQRAVRGGLFSSYLNGKPVAGVVVQKPLGVQFFPIQ